jgi:molecular chaperone DnaJ
MEIELAEAYNGSAQEITVTSLVTCYHCKGERVKPGTRMETCLICNGTGQVTQVSRSAFGQIMRTYGCQNCQGEGTIVKDPCEGCQGTGRVEKQRKLEVHIPPGVDTGSRIRIAGEGEAGTLGGESGDLYVFIHVKEHNDFHRVGDDLFYLKNVTFTQAALGAEVLIPTLEGEMKLKVPPGTQCDTMFKIRGKGMPNVRGHGRGDLHVKVWVMVPTHLNDKQKSCLAEFETCGSQEAHVEKGFFEKLKNALLGARE